LTMPHCRIGNAALLQSCAVSEVFQADGLFCHNNAASLPPVLPALPNADAARQQVPSIAGATLSLLLPALEAGLRCLAANGADGAVLEAAQHMEWVGASAHDSCAAALRQQPVGSRTEQREQQLLQQQLQALHITQLKCVLKNVARLGATAAGWQQETELSFKSAWRIVEGAESSCRALLAPLRHSSSSSSSWQIEADIEPAAATSSAAAAAAAPWVAVYARCFFVWASMLEAQTARSESDSAADAEQLAAYGDPELISQRLWQRHLVTLMVMCGYLKMHLKVIQLPPGVRQQLEQQLTAAT
jgi:hypothetical protein